MLHSKLKPLYTSHRILDAGGQKTCRGYWCPLLSLNRPMGRPSSKSFCCYFEGRLYDDNRDRSRSQSYRWGACCKMCGALHALHVTRHTSHVTRHTSHVTRHTSHVTRHTSHVTRHPSNFIMQWRDAAPQSSTTPAHAASAAAAVADSGLPEPFHIPFTVHSSSVFCSAFVCVSCYNIQQHLRYSRGFRLKLCRVTFRPFCCGI